MIRVRLPIYIVNSYKPLQEINLRAQRRFLRKEPKSLSKRLVEENLKNSSIKVTLEAKPKELVKMYVLNGHIDIVA